MASATFHFPALERLNATLPRPFTGSEEDYEERDRRLAAWENSIQALESRRQVGPHSTLQGRVILEGRNHPHHAPTQSEVARSIKNRNISPGLMKILVKRGWSAPHITALVNAQGLAGFEEVLSEQELKYHSKMVRSLLDPKLKRGQDDNEPRVENYQILLTFIPRGNASVLGKGQTEGEEVPFLSLDERNEVRTLFFPTGISEMTVPLRDWLNMEGFPEKCLEQLADLRDESLVDEIIRQAVELDLFKVLQALPSSAADRIHEQVEEAIKCKTANMQPIQKSTEEKRRSRSFGSL